MARLVEAAKKLGNLKTSFGRTSIGGVLHASRRNIIERIRTIDRLLIDAKTTGGPWRRCISNRPLTYSGTWLRQPEPSYY